jgi:rhodanese-related sulfurtransferase
MFTLNLSKGCTLEFIKENALLIGLAIGSGITLLWPMLNRGAAGVPNISPTEAVMLMSRSKPLVLDVRDKAEFDAGHIQGAKHVPLAELPNRIKELEKFKEKPVLVHCQKGMRAKTACTILRGQQFTKLHQLQGGLAAWQEAKLPVVKSA